MQLQLRNERIDVAVFVSFVQLYRNDLSSQCLCHSREVLIGEKLFVCVIGIRNFEHPESFSAYRFYYALEWNMGSEV